MSGLPRSVWPALGAAILFGASTPLAKQLIGEESVISSSFLLAGMLYLGSGLGLMIIRLVRDRGWKSAEIPNHEWPWLLGAITFGGVIGPFLLMIGLSYTSAATASLMLNLESVLTAVLAWVLFRENADRRLVLGMVLIIAGGAVLAWPADGWPEVEAVASISNWTLGPLALAGACLAWAIDNNLTRKVSASDAVFIAGSKGMVAGVVNTSLAFAIGATAPSLSTLYSALLVGFFGYGVSLVLFVLALRELGTARTGAYFSTAPFVGAAIAITIFDEPTNLFFWLASALMVAGVWLHLTERHIHEHVHDEMLHSHRHVHDEHHLHSHEFDWDGVEPHTHEHRHQKLTHRHAHFPNIHHRHAHR